MNSPQAQLNYLKYLSRITSHKSFNRASAQQLTFLSSIFSFFLHEKFPVPSSLRDKLFDFADEIRAFSRVKSFKKAKKLSKRMNLKVFRLIANWAKNFVM